jgi:hypothetical protein
MVLIDCFIVFYQSYCPGWDGLKFGLAWPDQAGLGISCCLSVLKFPW